MPFFVQAGTVPLPPSYSIDRFLLEDLISSICLTYCKNRRDTVLALIHHIDRLLQLSAPHVTVEVLVMRYVCVCVCVCVC